MLRPIFALAACALVSMLARAAPETPVPAARMDQVVREYVDAGKFSGAVLVARGGTVLFSKAYAFANFEAKLPNTTTTKFRLGSVTKQFTAASVLLLEERGKLKVEDLVSKYYPEAPAAWQKITLFHLLTHSSGIPNYTSFPDFEAFTVKPTTPEALVRYFRDKPLDFEPGAEMRYSNSGYALLGLVIEKASGKSYAQFVNDNLFLPLGMKDSGYESNPPSAERRASGYAPGAGGPVPAAYVDMTVPYAAGALYSTVEDLLRWNQGLYGHKLLSAASLKKMTTPFKNGYAFGLTVGSHFNHREFSHGGGINGFNSALAYYPDDGLTVAALSNLSEGSGEIVDKLSALALGEAVQLASERKELTLSADALKAYVGTYSLAPQFNLMITLDGDQLMCQGSGQGKAPLFAQSATSFFSKDVDARIDFEKDASGTVTGLVLHQGGRDMPGKRISNTVVEHREISVPASKLEAFAGTYTLKPGFDLVITVTGDHLTLSPTGQSPDVLFAESETRFFSKRVDAQIEFERDANGAVSGLVLHQGAFEGKAPKK